MNWCVCECVAHSDMSKADVKGPVCTFLLIIIYMSLFNNFTYIWYTMTMFLPPHSFFLSSLLIQYLFETQLRVKKSKIRKKHIKKKYMGQQG